MTATILHLPVDEAIFTRLTEQQRRANVEAERAECVRNARAVLRSPAAHGPQIIRDACAVMQAWGDGDDYLTADAMIFVLDRREREQAHAAARRAVETPLDVLKAHAHRWPEIVAWGAFVAVAMLAATGWLA